MKREEWFEGKWRYWKRFAPAALLGVILVGVGVSFNAEWLCLAMVGALLVMPLVIWLVMVPVYHWKDRYIGERNGLWGVLLVLETSGWSKIVYWFRHVLPDKRGSGRYADAE